MSQRPQDIQAFHRGQTGAQNNAGPLQQQLEYCHIASYAEMKVVIATVECYNLD